MDKLRPKAIDVAGITSLPAQGRLSGFRRRDLQIIQDSNAKILSEHTLTPVLPAIPSMYYVHGYSERGMSGGGYFIQDTNSRKQIFAGLISHHYFKNERGLDTKLHTADQSTGLGEVITLVIPVNEIMTWINEVLTQREERAVKFVTMDLSAQKQAVNAVQIKRVRFEEFSCDRNPHTKKEGTAEVGGQGSGIGGDIGRRICAVTVSLGTDETPAPFPLKHGWYEKLVSSLDPQSASFVGDKLYLTRLKEESFEEEVTDVVSTLAKLNSGL